MVFSSSQGAAPVPPSGTPATVGKKGKKTTTTKAEATAKALAKPSQKTIEKKTTTGSGRPRGRPKKVVMPEDAAAAAAAAKREAKKAKKQQQQRVVEPEPSASDDDDDEPETIIATDAAPAAAAEKKPRKPYRARRGRRSLRDIGRLQKTTNLQFPKSSFRRLIREISRDYRPDTRFSETSLAAIQEVTEALVHELFTRSTEWMAHCHRKSVMFSDFSSAIKTHDAYTGSAAPRLSGGLVVAPSSK